MEKSKREEAVVCCDSRRRLAGKQLLLVGSSRCRSSRCRFYPVPAAPLPAVKMMFDHPMGTSLGLRRKPSRVESAKRFWRVSRAIGGSCMQPALTESFVTGPVWTRATGTFGDTLRNLSIDVPLDRCHYKHNAVEE